MSSKTKQISIFTTSIRNLMEAEKEAWYESWFNTPYYHTLYKHRDYNEAQKFMLNLSEFLNFKKSDLILDLACGRGRHAVYLNSLGFRVIGADLSVNNIAYAKQFENERLSFEVHDMRVPFETKFDAILNMFTSFGFFEDDKEDIAILKNFKSGLKENGLAVIDFMNCEKVIEQLVPSEDITIDGITFNITRYVKDGFIVKEINFDDQGQHFKYFEKVKNLNFEKINYFLEQVGFKIKHIFGNYHLDNFNEKTSDRLILVLE